jgi:uncharacterized protein YggE
MKKENNAIVITSIISGVVLLIAITALVIFKAPDSSNSVTVDGVAEIKAMPDLVTVFFNIETKGTTSSEAEDANNLIFNKLSDALVAQEFEKTDIKTQGLSIYPNVDWSTGKEKQDGYKAQHSVEIEIPMEKMDKLTEVIDAGANSGAGISYINFELTQKSQNEYKAQALKLASEDAQIKADAVASGFGKKAGRLVSVSVSDFGYYPWNMYSARAGGVAEDVAMAKETAMNMQPSEQDITARVSATFRIQ